MAKQFLFTTLELQDLIKSSRALSYLPKPKIEKLLMLANDPSSSKAQLLYQSLIEEIKKRKIIDQNFIEETNKILTNLNTLSSSKHRIIQEINQKAEYDSRNLELENIDQILTEI